MDTKTLLEGVASQQFADKIPSSMVLKGDEVVKDVLTKGAAGALDYSYIKDFNKTISADSAKKQIDKINSSIPENPSPEEIANIDKSIAIIQKRLAGAQDTPDTNFLDYIAHKLIEIYTLPEGEMTSYGFPVTSQMKSNIIKGLTKQYDLYDSKGNFKTQFIGGSKSTRYGDNRPRLPRNSNGSINWEFFDTLFLLTRQKVSNEATIKKLVDYYISNGMKGTFSGLFMNNASLRYKDSYRETQSKKYRKGDGEKLNPNVDLTYDPTSSTGDIALDQPINPDKGSATVGDMAAGEDEASIEFDSKKRAAVKEIGEWIRVNRSEHDAQAWEGIFLDGASIDQMVNDNERYPLINDSRKVTNMFTALKVGKFPAVAKAIYKKHLPDMDMSDFNIKNLSANIIAKQGKWADKFKKSSADSPQFYDWSEEEKQRFMDTGQFPDEEDEELSGMTSIEDLDKDLYENMLFERVNVRIKDIIAEAMLKKTFNYIDKIIAEVS